MKVDKYKQEQTDYTILLFFYNSRSIYTIIVVTNCDVV